MPSPIELLCLLMVALPVVFMVGVMLVYLLDSVFCIMDDHRVRREIREWNNG